MQGLVQTQVRGLLRQQERRLLRCEGRVLLRVQMQHREQALLRFDRRAQARGPVMRPKRGQERPLYLAPQRRLLRVPEQGPHRGQALPQLSGGRGNPDNVEVRMQIPEVINPGRGRTWYTMAGRSQRLDVRWQKFWRRNGQGTRQEQRTMCEETSHVWLVASPIQHVALRRPRTTIFPWSGRPTDCPGGSICRRDARYSRVHNCTSLDTNIEPNNVANDCRNNDWHD